MNDDLRIFTAARRRAIFQPEGAPMVADQKEKRATGRVTALNSKKYTDHERRFAVARPAIIFSLLLASTAASAQAYRCVENGRAVISDRPCPQQQAKPTAKIQEKTAAQLQAEFEAEQADIKEGERLKSEISANKAKAEADKKKNLEEARRSCQAEKNKPPVVVNSGLDGSVQQVKQYLNVALKDPSSFEAITWGNVLHTCDGYTVFVKYRARNGFGGMSIAAQVFNMDRTGVVVSVDK